MGILRDLTGQRFGKLTAVERSGSAPTGGARWQCLCDCGNEKVFSTAHLVAKCKPAQSCGCMAKELRSKAQIKHGKCNTRTYTIWTGMMARCTNPIDSAYNRYGGGGRGICDRWLKFANFYIDMGDCPDGLTIERKDNEQGYSPENCIWASWREQANNRRSNQLWEYNGRVLIISQWAEVSGIAKDTLRHRVIKAGWSIEQAITIPVTRRGHKKDVQNNNQ
ncbi:hypothetical protein [Chroococcidiopsis sp.]|uniref:hypothetical protein n=1 Tax=Chroococcidiopsis sp. TaxID=3088168 RepID=UPI003F367E18